MLALRVSVNTEKPVTAGTEDLYVLSAAVTMVGKLGVKTVDRGRGKPDMFLHLGGLTARAKRKNEHLRWTAHRKLKVGDRVVVELVKTSRAGRIVERTAAETRSDLEHYNRLKQHYLELKKKYEPDDPETVPARVK